MHQHADRVSVLLPGREQQLSCAASHNFRCSFGTEKGFSGVLLCSWAVSCSPAPRARALRSGAKFNRPQQNYGVFSIELILILRITEMIRDKMPLNELPGHTERVKILLSKTLTGMPLRMPISTVGGITRPLVGCHRHFRRTGAANRPFMLISCLVPASPRWPS